MGPPHPPPDGLSLGNGSSDNLRTSRQAHRTREMGNGKWEMDTAGSPARSRACRNRTASGTSSSLLLSSQRHVLLAAALNGLSLGYNGIKSNRMGLFGSKKRKEKGREEQSLSSPLLQRGGGRREKGRGEERRKSSRLQVAFRVFSRGPGHPDFDLVR